MIQTFIIDWPVIILIGLLFGYGVKGVPTKSLLCTRAFLSGLLILTLFVILVYYSYSLAPDWMWMYFVTAEALPGWIVFYVMILYYFAYFSGFLLTIEGVKLSRVFPPILMILMVASEVAVILGLKERYINVGTLQEFIHNQTVPLSESAVGTVPAILSLFLIPLGLGFIVWSRRE